MNLTNIKLQFHNPCQIENVKNPQSLLPRPLQLGTWQDFQSFLQIFSLHPSPNYNCYNWKNKEYAVRLNNEHLSKQGMKNSAKLITIPSYSPFPVKIFCSVYFHQGQ